MKEISSVFNSKLWWEATCSQSTDSLCQRWRRLIVEAVVRHAKKINSLKLFGWYVFVERIFGNISTLAPEEFSTIEGGGSGNNSETIFNFETYLKSITCTGKKMWKFLLKSISQFHNRNLSPLQKMERTITDQNLNANNIQQINHLFSSLTNQIHALIFFTAVLKTAPIFFLYRQHLISIIFHAKQTVRARVREIKWSKKNVILFLSSNPRCDCRILICVEGKN